MWRVSENWIVWLLAVTVGLAIGVLVLSAGQ